MRTYTYAGPDGLELPGCWAAEWLVLDADGDPLAIPPDVAEDEGPLLQVELRPAGAAPWRLGLPLGGRDLAAVAHGLFALPGGTRVLVALGEHAWLVEPAARGRAEPVDDRVAGAVTSIVEDEAVLAVGSYDGLVGYGPGGLAWWVETEGFDQLSVVTVRDGVLHALAVLDGQAVALRIEPEDGALLEEPEVLADAVSIRRVGERRFVLHGAGGRRVGQARLDADRGAWRAPSIYGV